MSRIPAKPGGKIAETGTVVKTVAAPAATVADAEVVSDEPVEERGDGAVSNRPLTFELQLTALRPGGDSVANCFVEAHGLSYERLAELGIGMSERGSMKDRLAIPIHNATGELVAYCGCAVGRVEDADGEVYKFPPKFDRELELYGWHEAQNFEEVVLVEDVLAVIRHAQAAAHYGEHGFGVVALMVSTFRTHRSSCCCKPVQTSSCAFRVIVPVSCRGCRWRHMWRQVDCGRRYVVVLVSRSQSMSTVKHFAEPVAWNEYSTYLVDPVGSANLCPLGRGHQCAPGKEQGLH